MDEKSVDLTELYKKQISLTEWFANIKHSKTEELRLEDNNKRDRLAVLNLIIGLPFDKPHQFSAIDIYNQTDDFKKFLVEHGEDSCALRLIPFDPSLPKLRMRGQRVKDVVAGWFKEQKIDYSKYKADFVPNPINTKFSSIFIVNRKGIFGEIIRGGHNQLTQGFHDGEKPINFSYDFNEWKFSLNDELVMKHAKEIINSIKVEDLNKRSYLTDKLGSIFINNYLYGYFESVDSKDFGLWFIDYNVTLADMYKEIMPVIERKETLIAGQPASLGKVQGRVKIIMYQNLENSTINSDEILVCHVTTPDYFNLMQKSLGIITNGGGVLSHAGIVARERGKPCIVGTGNATEVLRDGDLIELDATNGIVRKL
ncbi:MAG: PEP-utilizing enzyme [Nanoarchaeota archaeon]